MKTFAYISLGCKVNSYESNALSDALIKQGYIKDDNNPDVVFINTCSVTQVADQKSRQHIRKLMNNYPNAISIVMGCYSQHQGKFIFNEIKPDIVIGTSNRDKIISYIKEYEKNKKRIYAVDEKPRLYNYYEELGISSYYEHARAYLKIEDGCNNFCSYCLIPLTRGKARSRNYDEIILEAKGLVEKGYKEIIVTGIDISYYGKDMENMTFSKLIKDLLDIKDLYRLRISSIEASEIDDELINLMNTRNNLAAHFHIPLQSGSDTVLKRMNRKYTCDEFYQKIKRIKQACPGVILTTDVIVGYPGESEKEFLETYNFIKKCGFNQLHVFPFSSRAGTKASKEENQIDPKIKKERSLKLIELSNQLYHQYQKDYLNKEVEVLIEQYDRKNKCSIGHTSNYLEVKIKGEPKEIGSIVKTIYQL